MSWCAKHKTVPCQHALVKFLLDGITRCDHLLNCRYGKLIVLHECDGGFSVLQRLEMLALFVIAPCKQEIGINVGTITCAGCRFLYQGRFCVDNGQFALRVITV